MYAALQTKRGRVLFWIGLVVLPVFWIWWMTGRHFSMGQIRSARLWTVVYMMALTGAWFAYPELRSRVSDLRWTYSHIAFQVGVVLWIWFVFRTTSIGDIIWGFIICIDIIANLSSQLVPFLQMLAPHPTAILFILIPSVAHLLVEPAQRLQHRVNSPRITE